MKRKADSETSAQSSHPLLGDAEQPSMKRFKQDYSSDLITVFVGSEAVKFTIHEANLCRSSNFFRSACSKSWKEGQDKLVELPEADAEAFKVYAHFVYSEILETNLLPEPVLSENENPAPPAYLNLGKMWILGNFLNDSAFMNRVIDRLLQKIDDYTWSQISADSWQYIEANTPQGCRVHRILLQMMTARMNRECLEYGKHTYTRELLIELARGYVSGRTERKSPMYADRCTYHTHEAGESKCQ